VIVYGDPSYERPLGRLQNQFEKYLSSVMPSLDEARTLVIFAGQMEQATHDRLLSSPNSESIIRFFEQQTDQAADIFHALWRGQSGNVDERLSNLTWLAAHANLSAYAHCLVRVKIPEGFAYYTLFPEQYCASAERWAEQHSAEDGDVLVIGIRSIGTSLSALVTTALKTAGYSARRITVRPTGHPFSRQTMLPTDILQGIQWAIIVDEGPGISGSSMASVGVALEQGGLPRNRITIFPGHAGNPGSAASDAVQDWWAGVARMVTPLEAVRWEDSSLLDSLLSKAGELVGQPLQQVEDWGGGLWRKSVYSHEAEWPPVCQPFERSKYLCAAKRVGVVWKFAGFPIVPTENDEAVSLAEYTGQKMQILSEAGFTPPPLSVYRGFIATPLLAGVPLAQTDANLNTFTYIGRYVAAASGPPMDESDAREAYARLCDMVYWNVWEALGETWAEQIKPFIDSLSPFDGPTYGDGHLAPYEWMRAEGDRLVKLDSGSHYYDHTSIGKQSVLWDVAGALCEWDADTAGESALISLYQQAAGLAVELTSLRFYQLAYSAFKAGQYKLCASIADTAERPRLTTAFEHWKRKLLLSIHHLLLCSR
jgi:hypothetical protein